MSAFETSGLSRRDCLSVVATGISGSLIASHAAARRETQNERREWTFETEQVVRSSPTVVNDTVYVGDNDGYLYAVDRFDGTERWQVRTDGAVVAAPNVVDETVYIGSADGNVYAYSTDDGSERWRREIGPTVESSPLVLDGRVYAGSLGEGSLYALDVADGGTVWSVEMDVPLFAGPLAAGGVVLCCCGHAVTAVSAETGDRIWTTDTRGGLFQGPTVADRTVFAGSQGSDTYALGFEEGQQRWEERTLGYAPPTVADGGLFVGAREGIYRLDPETGATTWRSPRPEPATGAPTVAGETVFVGEYLEGITAHDIASGHRRWGVDLELYDSSNPVVVDGTVYVGGSSLYAIDAGVEGSSYDSRVMQAVSSHHDSWDGTMPAADATFPAPESSGDSAGTDSSGDGGQSSANGSVGDASSAESTAGQSDGDDDGSDGLGPGFGVAGSVAGLLGGGYLLTRGSEHGDDR